VYTRILSLERALFAYSDTVKRLFGPKKKKLAIFTIFCGVFSIFMNLYTFLFKFFFGTKQLYLNQQNELVLMIVLLINTDVSHNFFKILKILPISRKLINFFLKIFVGTKIYFDCF
jgi:hypothetical protein